MYLGKREKQVTDKWLRHLRSVLAKLPMYSDDGDQELLADYLKDFDRKAKQTIAHAKRTGSYDLFEIFSFLDEIVRTHNLQKHFNEDAEYNKWEREKNLAKDKDHEKAVQKFVKTMPKVKGFDYWVNTHGDIIVENDDYPHWQFQFMSPADVLFSGDKDEYFLDISDDMGNRIHSERGNYSTDKDIIKTINNALKKYEHATEKIARELVLVAKDLIAFDKWKKMPKGWTDESRKKYWNTMTGDVKHKVTKCIKEMTGKVGDAGAFCASLADIVEGKGWRSEKRKKKSAEMIPIQNDLFYIVDSQESSRSKLFLAMHGSYRTRREAQKTADGMKEDDYYGSDYKLDVYSGEELAKLWPNQVEVMGKREIPPELIRYVKDFIKEMKRYGVKGSFEEPTLYPSKRAMDFPYLNVSLKFDKKFSTGRRIGLKDGRVLITEGPKWKRARSPRQEAEKIYTYTNKYASVKIAVTWKEFLDEVDYFKVNMAEGEIGRSRIRNKKLRHPKMIERAMEMFDRPDAGYDKVFFHIYMKDGQVLKGFRYDHGRRDPRFRDQLAYYIKNLKKS